MRGWFCIVSEMHIIVLIWRRVECAWKLWQVILCVCREPRVHIIEYYNSYQLLRFDHSVQLALHSFSFSFIIFFQTEFYHPIEPLLHPTCIITVIKKSYECHFIEIYECLYGFNFGSWTITFFHTNAIIIIPCAL